MSSSSSYFGDLDDAIRRAAFDRKVKVQFLLSYWNHTYASAFTYMKSLQDISSKLPCDYESALLRQGLYRIFQITNVQDGAPLPSE